MVFIILKLSKSCSCMHSNNMSNCFVIAHKLVIKNLAFLV